MVTARRRELLKGAARGGWAPGEASVYSWQPWNPRVVTGSGLSGLAALGEKEGGTEDTFSKIFTELGPVNAGAVAGALGAFTRSGMKMTRVLPFAALGAAMGYIAKKKLGTVGQDPMLVAVGIFVSTMYVPLPGGG